MLMPIKYCIIKRTFPFELQLRSDYVPNMEKGGYYYIYQISILSYYPFTDIVKLSSITFKTIELAYWMMVYFIKNSN